MNIPQSVTVEEANERLHDYAVTKNRQLRSYQFTKWSKKEREWARRNGWTIINGWREADSYRSNWIK